MAGMDIAKIAGILIVVFVVLWYVTGFLVGMIWWFIKIGVTVIVIFFVWQFFKKRFSS